jgi:hypothetical protein
MNLSFNPSKAIMLLGTLTYQSNCVIYSLEGFSEEVVFAAPMGHSGMTSEKVAFITSKLAITPVTSQRGIPSNCSSLSNGNR